MLKQQNPLRSEDRTLSLALNDMSDAAIVAVYEAASQCALPFGDARTFVSMMKFMVMPEVRL